MQSVRFRMFYFVACMLAVVLTQAGQSAEAKKKVGHRCTQMNYGPFISATCGAGGDNFALKGIIVRLDKERDASICFDTELLRVSAGWSDGYIDWKGPAFDQGHGAGPNAQGKIRFATTRNPGWANNGAFTDPRGSKDGPLPASWAKYKGLYLNGSKVIFSYTVGDAAVLESHSAEFQDVNAGFSRHFTIASSKNPLLMAVCENDKGAAQVAADKKSATLTIGGDQIHAGLVGAPEGAEFDAAGGRVALKLPALAAPASFKVVIANLPTADAAKFAGFLKGAAENLEPLTKGGPARWTETVTTQGKLGTADAPYVVDTISVPEENPYKSWMRLGGLDFFADGKRAAVSTWSGDVWIVSGIDEKLENVTWKRFATGLFQPLGLKIVDEVIHTLGRDQITRLHDLNKDGEADFYENFNNDCTVTTNFHEFAFDLQTDKEGNFYYTKGAPVRGGGRNFERIAAHNGCLMKVSKDGSNSEVFATGFRAPNGIAIGPNGEITSGDNEGTWQPRCPLNWIKKGGFYGVKDTAHMAQAPEKRDTPICWFPMSVDNSSGGQVWVTSDKWGPFQGELLHLSYGKCSLYKVMYEMIGGVPQGGVVKFPLTFSSGILRAKFNAADGQLYMVGLRGWQTTAAKDGCFERVRFTGKPVTMPTKFNIKKGAIEITYTGALDPATATDAGNWSGEVFNVSYLESGTPGVDKDAYGSPEFSVIDSTKKGHDPVTIKSIKISPDGKVLTLEIPDLKPVTNMILKYRVKTAEGKPMVQEIDNTINVVPQ